MIFMVQHLTNLYELFFYLGVGVRFLFIIGEMVVSSSDYQILKHYQMAKKIQKEENTSTGLEEDTSLDSTTCQFTMYHFFKVVI
eukprot:CAMPEP_0170552594 /NCGR_PEP_ID=MMETSP0211-20121228/10462_1 /TAXON_ID=311385 /ORGANISM="Pseudokeronopsis sp., Strain OXSARD2" /LENGTH=83 /DNA_ID=CAMNT_0010860405 /DNA_START=534 /DNA_END=785 /DNA_ORIENTATION=-